ncbi:MAG TPA: tRNA epoxyqueuosine(34) reductase QueG [Candidatus Udaeobacter sp.]|jgi:epoxyqueuosine reductase|nr:tRNA epoxyqueuosine(34) reductase QueG [Candidatus Udaeobacter sp.]
MTEICAQELKRQVVAFARQIGFDSCRVAACDQPPHANEFRAWLREGAHGEMDYMQRGEEKRCDPQKVLAGTRSIVVLALNYFQGDATYRAAATAKTGKIARYAWGDDYHDVITTKLDDIDSFLRQFGGRQKCYVDTGPILERDYAAQAGIGWHGKNTMLIGERLGTWFFLAEILTTLELPPDEPVPDRCGTCERCITACPTGAITNPHRLDARRCISYLTIELKGSIPLELRPLIGDRIFGCDDCLQVCPWNRFARVSHETAFAARQSTAGMLLRDYLELNDDQFRELFKKSPIKRIKRRGFLRNVCVALGNVGDASDLPTLGRAAADPEPLIAEHAAWAIEQIQARQSSSHSRFANKIDLVEESCNQTNPNDFLAASQLCHERDFVCQSERTN